PDAHGQRLGRRHPPGTRARDGGAGGPRAGGLGIPRPSVVTVVQFPVGADSKYIALMTSALAETHVIEYLRRPDLGSLIRRAKPGKALILHVHWEERAFAGCESDADALVVASRLAEQLTTFRQRGGRIVWTVHNGLP